MITRISENTAESGNKTVEELMDELVAFLKEDGVGIDTVNYNNKTIYVKTPKDLDEASWQVRNYWKDAQQMGIRIAQNINVPGLNKVLPKSNPMSESKDDEEELFINTGNNWAIYVDYINPTLHGKTRTKREAQQFMKDMGYTKDSEVWIEPITGTNTENESCKLVETVSTSIPTITRISKDVDVVYEYVVRDLFKMQLVGSGSDEVYYAGRLNKNQIVVAILPANKKPTFYIFSNLTEDELSDCLTLLSTSGTDYMWDNFVNDYAGFPATFWEFVQEWQ